MYRMYVDEVGNDDLNSSYDEKHRFLSLTGVIANLDHVRDFINPEIEKIKTEIFRIDPDERINFHRKDIMGCKGCFGVLSDPVLRAAFDKKIIDYITAAEFRLITILLDKRGMSKIPYWRNQHPYHYLIEILVEKYALFLGRRNAVGDIMPEARNSKKDQALQNAFLEVRDKGTHYVSANHICRCIPSKQLKFRRKQDNIAGLQIADLLAHPSHIKILSEHHANIKRGPFCDRILPILEDCKYDRALGSGKIEGYGTKYLP